MRNGRSTSSNFPPWPALGFCAVQAKGLDWPSETPCSQSVWRPPVRGCRATARLAGRPEDLEVDYIERYAFENADVQAATNPAVWIMRGEWAGAEGPTSFEEKGPPRWRTPTPRCWNGSAWGTAVRPWKAISLVSICVAHYNLGRHLPETLDSLRGKRIPEPRSAGHRRRLHGTGVVRGVPANAVASPVPVREPDERGDRRHAEPRPGQRRGRTSCPWTPTTSLVRTWSNAS